MEKLKKNIDKQFQFNKGKNLFHPDAGNILKFIRETIAESQNIKEIDDDQEKGLIGYATDKALQEFCRSLKPGGSFHYAPDLPYIEQFMEDSQWELSKHVVWNYGFKTAVVKRICRNDKNNSDGKS